MDATTKHKFPKSINNQQCIGPCYKAGTLMLHPITLTYFSHPQYNICPTYEWYDKTEKTNKIVDKCFVPSKEEDISKYHVDLSFIEPEFGFTCDFFLKTCYNVYSFESALDVISNIPKSTSLRTLMRIIECAWREYGNSLDVINDQLVE